MRNKVKIITDSREQKPLEFRKGAFSDAEVKGMPCGDYWCEINDAEIPIVFERKSLGDLFGTMTTGYDRFKRELSRAKEFGIKLILVIEGSIRDVAKGYKHSSFDGDSMLKKLATLHIKYDLEYHYFNDRREMARFIEETFLAVERNWKSATKGVQTAKVNDESDTGKTGDETSGDQLRADVVDSEELSRPRDAA